MRDECAQLLRDPFVAAVGACRIGIGHADELLEMRLAAHADVFVDRHWDNPTKGILAARPDAYAGRSLMRNVAPAPGVLSTSTSPPIARASSRTIDKPSPVPTGRSLP